MARPRLERERYARRSVRGRRRESGTPPPVGVVDVVERDADGDLYVRPTKGDPDAAPVRLAPDRAEKPAGAPGLGDRLLVRFERLESGETEARLIKRLGQSAHRVLGVVRKGRGEVTVEPVDRKSRERLSLTGVDAEGLSDGDLVLTEVGAAHQRYGPKRGRLLDVLGREDEPRAASMLAIHTHGLPTGFSAAAEAEADAAEPPELGNRVDLRDLPLITIDPSDARDHDDAVFAHADDDQTNRGGWIVWVAIADVAAYVRARSALDREAREKANSVYFPDRVEPMLPERLSAGLCSLRAGESRACIAVRMTFDAAGRKLAHRFVRGLMHSVAGISYEQAQAAIDGMPDAVTTPLLEPVLTPLWAAYAALKLARDKRAPLEIDSLERRIVLGDDGRVLSITPRRVLDAHRLIEEMMIQANVAAAETLEQRRTPLIYRVHDTPSLEKIKNLSDFLATLDIRWSMGEAPRTDRFNRLLAEVRGGPQAEIVNEVVLRTQMQAIYDTENIGHFGLNLNRYAHFTSPIRRYADVTVHRGLIRALGLGDDGLTDQEIVRLTETAEHVTMAERRGMAAERDANDRYVAAFMDGREGADFAGRITGVTRFGLFVRLAETGADGLVPVSSLGDEYFIHDDRTHALVGERTGRRWRLGAAVEVRLREATPVTGGLLLEMLSEPEPPDPKAPRPRLGQRRRGRR
ncbi:MAG TPA: ribonuclease R [Caulobacteraceae bacterium]|nr:ribonuclease R [Caulobacteraceae bacterium]